MSGLHTIVLWTADTTCLSHSCRFLLLQLLFLVPQQWKTLVQRAHIGVQPSLGKYNNAFFLLLIADSGIT